MMLHAPSLLMSAEQAATPMAWLIIICTSTMFVVPSLLRSQGEAVYAVTVTVASAVPEPVALLSVFV